MHAAVDLPYCPPSSTACLSCYRSTDSTGYYFRLHAAIVLIYTDSLFDALQIHRQFRKPLLVLAPKNLLRHPEAKSGLWEFDDKADDKGILGVRFKRLIMDVSAEDRYTCGALA